MVYTAARERIEPDDVAARFESDGVAGVVALCESPGVEPRCDPGVVLNELAYNRTTDRIELRHLEISSVQAILREHADATPERLLFLWNLFEGVPKFYRDCFEQGVLGASRAELLERIWRRSR